MLYNGLNIIQCKDMYVLLNFPIPFMQNGYLAEAYPQTPYNDAKCETECQTRFCPWGRIVIVRRS
jgi:hypothetical protein